MNARQVQHAFALGAEGVQVATPFVTTEECDAAPAYKQAYVNAKKEDIEIVTSPVGMPGRAIHNAFLEKVAQQKEHITTASVVWKNVIPPRLLTASPRL